MVSVTSYLEMFFSNWPPFPSSGPAAARGSSSALTTLSRPWSLCISFAWTCRASQGLGREGQQTPRPQLTYFPGPRRPLPQPQWPLHGRLTAFFSRLPPTTSASPKRLLPAPYLPTLHLQDPGPSSLPPRPRVPGPPWAPGNCLHPSLVARAPCHHTHVIALCSSSDCGVILGRFLVEERMMEAP